ncbi:MAG TPA: glycoside hydrolase family 31 protein [Spirochaetia bacterium]|nr:glycoside hydrolase family 31 protein [Spirochaetia bacterium]
MLRDAIVQFYLERFYARYGAKRRAQLRRAGPRRLEALPAARLEGPVPGGLAFRAGRALIRVQLLGPGLARVCLAPEGRYRLSRSWSVCGPAGEVPVEGRPRDDLSAFELPESSWREEGGRLELEGTGLRARIELDPFRITWVHGGSAFAADAAAGAFRLDPRGRAVGHAMERRGNCRYYGFGERTGTLDKDGRVLANGAVDALGYGARRQDPLYKRLPWYLAWDAEARLAYGLYYDNLAEGSFDLGSSDPRSIAWEADDGDADYYLIFGPSIPEVLRGLSSLIGRPAMPPRWALGYLGSTMGLADLPEARERLAEFPARCRERGLPCSLFHLSSGYSLGEDGKRYVFEWNARRFPDPAAFVGDFRSAGMPIAANVKPCLLTSHPRYAEAAAKGAFVAGPDGEPAVLPFWGGLGSFIDFSAAAGRAWWKSRAAESLLGAGIDSTWNDNNEFEIWDDRATCAAFGAGDLEGGRAGANGMRGLLAYHMVRASLEAQLEARPGKRPFLVTRSACAGTQRYAQSWSGDNYASWETLAWNLPTGLGMALSGMPSYGHDVGGFAGFKPGPELFLRWVQAGVLQPRFTIHSWHFDRSENEAWMYPELFPAVKAAILLRYRLVPYLYSLFALAARSGDPIARPMVYEFPEDARCADESFDFMLGPFLLAACVLEKGARSRRAWLPAGEEWIELDSGARHPGGAEILLEAPLERIPILARGGAIVPTEAAPPALPGEAAPAPLRELLLFPASGGRESSFAIFEDDGDCPAFAEGSCRELSITMRSSAGRIEVGLSQEGGYPLPYAELALVLPPGEERPLFGPEGPVATVADARGRRRGSIALS